MLRISKQTDYGLVLLSRFVRSGPKGGPYSAKDLAADTKLPIPMVGKILKLLTKAGLLLSHRGAKGGYRLAMEPEKISVARVIRALDGPIAITRCVGDEAFGAVAECENTNHCPLCGNWKRINMVVQSALDSVSLREMVHPV